MEILKAAWVYATGMGFLGFAGFFFGTLCVVLLVRQNIWTWPMGIIYVLISFVVFWQAKLYADFILHIFFLALNIYGWYYWIKGHSKGEEEVPVTTTAFSQLVPILLLSAVGIALSGFVLDKYTDASLPYWDSTTSILSIAGMWLTAKKKIENWYFWLVVDVLATGIYYYKGIYFYFILYLIYIGLAVVGYRSWKKTMQTQTVAA
ncbi:MAG: nicotinamide riboside transporter PnuC [Cyclobacteriaceae bacterium]